MRMRSFVFGILMLFTSVVFGQTITGYIYDAKTKEPLNGANIRVKNIKEVAVSDKKGFFTLNIPGENQKAELLTTYVGYADSIIEVSLPLNKPLNIYLRATDIMLEQVVVTANRHLQKINEIPGRTEVIPKEVIESLPVTNADEVLQLIPGVFTDRDFGIYSKNASVNMRGLNSSQRVLVMKDGTPINKADGGGVNWNRIFNNDIERIEVLKGPSSAIYGGNAMAGVINVITAKPKDKFSGYVEGSAGTYNTYGLGTHFGGKLNQDKGLYYSVSTFYRKGDGYYVNTPENRTVNDTTVFVKEGGASGTLGYSFNQHSSVELEYDYWDDIRSDGVRVHEKLGSYNKYTTHATRLTYKDKFGKGDFTFQPYFQNEYYFHKNEAQSKKSGKYKLYDAPSDRDDYGLFTSYTLPEGENTHLTFGVDAKTGNVTSKEIYYTSTDVTTKKGQMNQFAGFGIYDVNLLKNKLNLSLGLRWDLIQFRNGSFIIETPSTLTDFIRNYPSVYEDEDWNAFSPKAAVKYHFTSNFNAYVSFGTGYSPATLDDMCTNRNVTKGFKLANPKLAPEYLYSYEAGYDWRIHDKIKIEMSFYNSIGHDFHYFVGTGDSVDTGGDELKAVLIRDNIASVNIYGNETSVSYFITNSWTLLCNYAYNYSYISKFQNDNYQNKNLEGKFLMEVPPHVFNAFLMYKYKKISADVSYHFEAKKWADDENTYYTPGFYSINLKLSVKPVKNIKTSVLIENVTNNEHLNNKGQLCLGRFILFEVKYQFD